METMKADQQQPPTQPSSKQNIRNRRHHHRVSSCGASIPCPQNLETDPPVCNGINLISRGCNYSQDDLNIHAGVQNYRHSSAFFCSTERCKICTRRSLPSKSAKQLFKNMKLESFSNETVVKNDNHQPRARHRSAESISCTPQRSSTEYGDDMNNYFQANAHLLQFLNNDSRQEGGGENADQKNGNGVNETHGPVTNCSNENCEQTRSRTWSDYDALNDEIHTPSSEDDGIATSYNYAGQDLDEGLPDVFHNGIENINDVDASCMTNTMESDDQGDFIETDFVGHSNFDCMNSGDEKNYSSDEDINRYQRSDSNLIVKDCTGACNFDNNHQKETGKKVLQSPVFDRDDSISDDRTVTCQNNSWRDIHVNDLSDTSVEDNAMDDCVPIINACDRDKTCRPSAIRGSVSHTSDSSIDACAITPESLSLWSPDVEYPELNTIELNHSSLGLRVQRSDNVTHSDLDLPHSDDDGIGAVSMEESFNIPNIPNNLNEVFSSDPSSDHEDELYNVSRQTSTSNFDNDENSFQGDDHENSNTDNEDKIFDEGIAVVPVRHFEEMGFSPDFHQKLRVDEATRGHYSRLLDYDLSSSDEDEVVDREASEPIYVDIDAEDQEASTSGENGTQQNIEMESDEKSASNTLPEQSRLAHKKVHKNSIQKIMVWSEYEAYISQVKQIGWSACGPTAVINILKAFDVFCDKEKVNSVIKTNLRAEKATVPEYLLSRSVAGTTAPDLITGIQTLTDGAIYGRFFSFYPRRKVDILRWLGYWISRGAVPLVTLNLQKAVPPGWVTPDAWHHQMVYGVGPKGVYLTNPLEIVPVSIIEQQLCSDSVLLVRRSDVLTRWADECDLSQLITVDDARWREMNVLGQTVSVLREANAPGFQGYKLPWTSHICIPAVYKAGVTLYVKRDSESYKELSGLEELPFAKEKKD